MKYLLELWASKQKKIELPLPNMNYSVNQLFWIHNAQQECNNYDEETWKYYVTGYPEYRIVPGTHTPGGYRTNYAFMVTPEFAKDFNCKAGRTMNPKLSCKISTTFTTNPISKHAR